MESHTPEIMSPRRTGAAGITQAQKQALIDNLQLEITERARKLRAQYALQAQALRARMEMRINRIPQAMRKRKMQDLMDECAQREKPAPSAPIPVVPAATRVVKVATDKDSSRKSLKRTSDQISTVYSTDYNDKENMPAQEVSNHEPLPNPKKRAKAATTTANTKATRTTSRSKAAPSSVLSPKSHNSRTLPRSPFKPAPGPPEKALPPPPASRYALPTKTSTLAPPTKPASRAPSRQTAKRGAAANATETDVENEGRSSEASTTSSAGTTIITKPAAKRAPAAARKPPVPKAAAVGKKTAAAIKKENVPPVPAAGGRTLRKRG